MPGAHLSAAQQITTLSQREREVLKRLAAGQTNQAIASDLGLFVRTVEIHRARMLDKLGVQSLAEAIRLAVLAGI
jgi:two-component system response regulator FixJ